MSFRRRLTLSGTAAMAVAILLASGIAFAVLRGELRGQVDESLRESADEVGVGVAFVREVSPPAKEVVPLAAGELPLIERQLVAPAPLSGPGRYAQLVEADGTILPQPGGGTRLPVSARARHLASSGEGSFFSDQELDGVHVRVYTRALEPGLALQVARPVEEVDGAVARVGWILAVVGLGGVGLAGGLGLVVTRTATRPLRELSSTADHVARTQDLSRRIEAEGDDELSRLASSFNTMLETLERSQGAQRRLVADASHELRTPLTSLRTNIEVLAGASGMPPGERRRLLDSVVGQLEELTALVGDLVDLARDGQTADEPAEPLRLDLLAAAAVARARQTTSGARDRVGALALAGRGGAVAARPGAGQPARQRREVEPAWDGDRGARRRRAGPGARPRARHRPRGPAPRVRPLLPGAGGAWKARLGPRPRDRAAGRGEPRWERRGRQRPGRWGAAAVEPAAHSFLAGS
jgi:two-component system sensor histidine kinase MprB